MSRTYERRPRPGSHIKKGIYQTLNSAASPVFHLNELLETPLDNNLPKADAERVALLADVDRWLKGDTKNPLQDAEEVLWAVHAYLQGGAA